MCRGCRPLYKVRANSRADIVFATPTLQRMCHWRLLLSLVAEGTKNTGTHGYKEGSSYNGWHVRCCVVPVNANGLGNDAGWLRARGGWGSSMPVLLVDPCSKLTSRMFDEACKAGRVLGREALWCWHAYRPSLAIECGHDGVAQACKGNVSSGETITGEVLSSVCQSFGNSIEDMHNLSESLVLCVALRAEVDGQQLRQLLLQNWQHCWESQPLDESELRGDDALGKVGVLKNDGVRKPADWYPQVLVAQLRTLALLHKRARQRKELHLFEREHLFADVGRVEE